MARRGRVTDEELDALGAAPRPGEVWWCEGAALGLRDGGKTRPVLVLESDAAGARVIPMTSRRPPAGATVVRHRGGASWLAGEARAVPPLALLSPLGAWAGWARWREENGR